jgi:hypothetical protein
MNRCNARTLLRPLVPLVIVTLGLLQAVAHAQTTPQADPAAKRRFPTASLRGEMVVTAPPEILMDDRPDRLSPGARIRDTENRMVVSGTLANQRVVVNYVRDHMGQVSEAWILTQEEARERRRGLFEIITNYNTNSTPAHPDDGKTPYDQLPAYGK